MKTVIVYKSIHHNNTKKVAEAMAEVLGAELLESHEFGKKNLTDYDLIGFGSGIYFGKHHRALLNLIDRLPYLKDKRVFVFSTSGLKANNLFNRFDKIIKAKLKARGLNIVGEFFCRGHNTYGPFGLIGGLNKGRPNKKDLAKAKMFAESLL